MDLMKWAQKYGMVAAIAVVVLIFVYIYFNMESKPETKNGVITCSNGGKLATEAGVQRCLTRAQAMESEGKANMNGIIIMLLIGIIAYLLWKSRSSMEMAPFVEVLAAAFNRGDFWELYHIRRLEFNINAIDPPTCAPPDWIMTGTFNHNIPRKRMTVYLRGRRGDSLFGRIVDGTPYPLARGEIKKERDRETDIGKIIEGGKKAKELGEQVKEKKEEEDV
jgi:hypothetical protein